MRKEDEMIKTKIFEAYVLRILDIQFILFGIIYLFYKEWSIGIFLIAISFLFGVIGQGLKQNKEKSAVNLLRGQNWDIDHNELDQNLSSEESIPMAKTMIIVLITTSIVLLHHDYHFYSALPLGFLIGIFYPMILLKFDKLVTKFIKRKN